MHETSKRIIILLIIVLLGVIFYETSILIKALSKANELHNNQMNILSGNSSKLNIEYGKYVVSYNTIFEENDEHSFIEIYENGTFSFNVNLCEGIYEYRGFFSVNDKTLTIKNINNNCTGFLNCDKSEFSFEIKDNKTIAIKENVACLGKNSTFVLE